VSTEVIQLRAARRQTRSRALRRLRAFLLRFYRRALTEPSPIIDPVKLRLL